MKTRYHSHSLLDKALSSELDNEVFLVAPLNWGLGHAARCIPLIECLIAHRKKIILASDGGALSLLKATYPDLPCYELPSYGISYPHNSIVGNILVQSPGIITAILKEKKAVNQIVQTERIEVIVSDNRYGVLNKNTHNIIICHQIALQHSVKMIGGIGSALNRYLLNRFDCCWIPDLPPPESIAPELSRTAGLKKYQHIGLLSRMNPQENQIVRKYLVVLSGPEPSRTKLEKKLLEVLPTDSFLMVRGVLEKGKGDKEQKNVVNYLTHDDLAEEINRSEIIICRSGYTSIMDLLTLNKKAILIPTPGQTEQGYLAKEMTRKYPDLFVSLTQEEAWSFKW